MATLEDTETTVLGSQSNKRGFTNNTMESTRSNANSRTSTPFSSRPNSSTNLATKMQIMGSKMGERSASFESLKYGNNSATPRTSNRFTIQTTPRNVGGIHTPRPSTPVKPGSAGKVSTLSSGDKDKKRLVNQFYNSYNDTGTGGSSVTDLGSLYKNGLNDSPSADRTYRFGNYLNSNKTPSSESFSSMALLDLVNSGSFTYYPLDDHDSYDESLTNYLLNIDTIVSRESDYTQSNSLADILESACKTITTQSKSRQSHAPSEPYIPQSFRQLESLTKYLSDLHRSTTSLLTYLEQNQFEMKDKYGDDIKNSVHKLDDLLITVGTLEDRLHGLRSIIGHDKSLMSDSLSDKLALLEKIDKRITEHGKISRQRRFNELAIGITLMSLLCLLLGIYRI